MLWDRPAHLECSRPLANPAIVLYAMYHWTKDAGTLNKVSGVHSHDHSGLSKLKPGDLLFWEGTYATAGRVPPISHVMIYLRTLKEDGKKVMYGASSGRRYRGKKIHGASVFDFSLPKVDSKAKFVGYSPIPGFKSVKPAPKKTVAFRKKTESEVTKPVAPKKTATAVETKPVAEEQTPPPTTVPVATARKTVLPKLFPKLRAALSKK